MTPTKFFSAGIAIVMMLVLNAGVALVTSSESSASAWGDALMKRVQQAEKYKTYKRRSGSRETWKSCREVRKDRVKTCLKFGYPLGRRAGKKCMRYQIAHDHAGKACR